MAPIVAFGGGKKRGDMRQNSIGMGIGVAVTCLINHFMHCITVPSGKPPHRAGWNDCVLSAPKGKYRKACTPQGQMLALHWLPKNAAEAGQDGGHKPLITELFALAFNDFGKSFGQGALRLYPAAQL